ncbi:hypothetical protein F0562_033632 [Nyssa sinensis]|uniref:Retrotransposon gag domain-containing protein n=1 Tax=Nyssa sinensis TaxID=561372 RepID=A0A5J5AH65_9ASTE|nr:hypothetical protein F0562_033632 [Nyssa sinensis]
MPPRRQRNVGDATLRDQMAQLHQSNQTLQQMMVEILHRIPTSPTRSQRSHSRSTRSQNTTEEGFDSSSTIGNSEAAFDDRWTMERLARALEGTDRSVQVHVSDFEGKLDPDEYCDWIASLQAFFEWKNLTEERKSLYQKFHRLRQRNDQSVADYTEHFYKLLSRINLTKTDDQLVARYMAGLKFNLQSELMLHSIHSLEEAYQMALKAEEKAKWTPFRKSDNSKASNEKMVTKSKKNSAPNSQHPNPHAGEGKKESGKAGSSSSFKCFRCGEAGHSLIRMSHQES